MKELWYNIKNFFRNLCNYRKILWNDKQFDFGYLLELEKLKLQLMIKEFKTHPHTDHTSNIRWMQICIKLIDIIQEDDSALEYSNVPNTEKFKLVKYINIRNASRFKFDKAAFESKGQIFIKECLRQRKALYLYSAIRYNYIFEWWD